MLLSNPSLKTRFVNNQQRNAVSFVYDFSSDVVQNQNLGGVAFTGSSYKFDITTLNNPAASNLPILKSLQFSMSFNGQHDGTPEIDGSLYIYIPISGQFMRFAQPNETAPTLSYKVLTGLVPILANTPTEVIFAKSTNNMGDLQGILNVTLFDETVPSYISSGISTSA